MTLTDTHRVLLSAAAQHAHGLLLRPEAMPDKAAQTLSRKLVRARLAEEVTLSPNQPSWREDEPRRVSRRRFGLDHAAKAGTSI